MLPADSYLNVPNLIAAAETTGCDAVHPGWGFLAENAGFVRACTENDLMFVGPSAEAIEMMGDKSPAKQPCAPPACRWCRARPTVSTAPTEARRAGRRGRLPGAAQGRRRRRRPGHAGGRVGPDELEDAYRLASAEAASAFGDGDMYLEKAIVDPRHVEMQVLADGAGGVLVLGERDCSVQRRHQKLIEEGPSPALDPPTREAMAEAARPRVHRLRLRERRHGRVPARRRRQLLVHRDEHPAAGRASGVGAASPASTSPPSSCASPAASRCRPPGWPRCAATRSSFASTARIPRHDFRPAAGTVTRFRPPLGPGVRLDTHAYEGYKVPPFYDSLLAKLIVWGADRAQAIARSRRALAELEIEGVAHHPRAVPGHPGRARLPCRAGYTTAYLEQARDVAAVARRRGGAGMSVRAAGAVLADEAIVSIVRGAVGQVTGARLDRPGRVVAGAARPARRRSSGRVNGGAIGVRRRRRRPAYGVVLPEVAPRCARASPSAVGRDDRPGGAVGGRHRDRHRPRGGER